MRRPLESGLHALIAVVHEAGEGVVPRAWVACARASSTQSVRIEADTRQPTMRRAKTSITTATNTKPPQVATEVQSDTQS